MKKSPRKLVVRSETLRALTKTDLTRAISGLAAGVVAFDTGDVACDAPHLLVAVATAACV